MVKGSGQSESGLTLNEVKKLESKRYWRDQTRRVKHCVITSKPRDCPPPIRKHNDKVSSVLWALLSQAAFGVQRNPHMDLVFMLRVWSGCGRKIHQNVNIVF